MTEDYSTLIHVSKLVTNERVSKALTDWFKEKFTFTHWKYVSGTGKGDSYLSELMRIRLYGMNNYGEHKSIQVILKIMPRSIARKLTFRSDEFFKNEINFYTIVLPALLAFQSTKRLKDPFDNYAKLLFAYSDGCNDVVCLEDVSVKKFRSTVRQKGIDTEHCKITLKVLAQFHALSFAMKDQEPEKFEKLQNSIMETYYHGRYWDWFKRYWKRISNIAIDAVEKEFPNSIYVEKIRQFASPETYQDLINVATKTTETGVITHGDPWTNNFLYKYKDGRPVKAKVIDFQLSRCGTVIMDVSFMIYACTSLELRDKYYDEWLKFYHDNLSKQIKDLGSDPSRVYPWELFMDEVKKYSFFGLASSMESTPLIVLAPEDAINMDLEGDEAVNIDDVWQLENFKTREDRLREANNVKHCVDMGYI